MEWRKMERRILRLRKHQRVKIFDIIFDDPYFKEIANNHEISDKGKEITKIRILKHYSNEDNKERLLRIIDSVLLRIENEVDVIPESKIEEGEKEIQETKKYIQPLLEIASKKIVNNKVELIKKIEKEVLIEILYFNQFHYDLCPVIVEFALRKRYSENFSSSDLRAEVNLILKNLLNSLESKDYESFMNSLYLKIENTLSNIIDIIHHASYIILLVSRYLFNYLTAHVSELIEKSTKEEEFELEFPVIISEIALHQQILHYTSKVLKSWGEEFDSKNVEFMLETIELFGKEEDENEDKLKTDAFPWFT